MTNSPERRIVIWVSARDSQFVVVVRLDSPVMSSNDIHKEVQNMYNLIGDASIGGGPDATPCR